MHTDIFILQPPAHLHTLSAGRQTAPAALLEGWLWAFPPLLVIIGALAAKLGVVLTPLTFLPSSPGSSRLVTINLDILLTAALLDGLFGLVWFDCASAPDNMSMFHSTLLSAGIGVLGIALLGFVNIRLVNTLQSLLTPHQRRRKKKSLVTEMGYKPWGMVLIVRNRKFKTVYRPGLLALPHSSIGAVLAKELHGRYLANCDATGPQQSPVPGSGEVPPPDPTPPERNLQAEVDVLQQQLSQTIANSQRRVRELNDALRSKDILVEQLRTELQAGSRVGQDNERLQTELATRNAEISQLRSEIDDVTNSTRVEVQQLRSERIQRDKELSELQRQKANLEDQVAEKSQLLEDAMEEQVRIVKDSTADRQALEAAQISIVDLEERSTRQTKTLENMERENAHLEEMQNESRSEIQSLQEQSTRQAKTLENMERENAQLKEMQNESRSEIQSLQEQLQKSLAENEALRAQLLLQGRVQDAQEGISSHLPPNEDSPLEGDLSYLSFSGAVFSLQSLDSMDVGNGSLILQPLASTSASSLSPVENTEDSLAAHLPPLGDESTIMPITAADITNLAQVGSQEHASEVSPDVLSTQNLYGSDYPPNKRDPPEEPQVLTWEEKRLEVLERLGCERDVIDRYRVQRAEKRDEVSPYISRMLNIAAGLPARSAAYKGPALDTWLRGLSANSSIQSVCGSDCSPNKGESPEERQVLTLEERQVKVLERLKYEQGITDRYRAQSAKESDEMTSSTSQDDILKHVPLLEDDDDDDDDDASLVSSDSIQFGFVPDWLQGRLMDVSLEPLSAVSSSWSLSGQGDDFIANKCLAPEAQEDDDLAAHIPPTDGASMCSSESSLVINFDGVSNEFMEPLLATSLSGLWAVSPDF